MKALVLCPTRELSMQVCDHIKRITQGTTVRAMPIVGGMSSQKQQRLLRSRPDIVVATPGRFYELRKEGESWLRLQRVRCADPCALCVLFFRAECASCAASVFCPGRGRPHG